MTPVAQQVAVGDVQAAQAAVAAALGARDEASKRVAALEAEVAALDARLVSLPDERQRRAQSLLAARGRLKKMAVARYMATPAAPINYVMRAPSFSEVTRRAQMLGVVTRSDQRRIAEHEAAEAAAPQEEAELVLALDRARFELEAARSALQSAEANLVAKQAELAAAEAGSHLVAGGFLFPVAGPNNFSDSFGAPRMTGTVYAHAHQGTDIFAATGTPLIAVERGVVIKVGVTLLGGNRLWLVGASGTRYFYAHLSAFAPGTSDGVVVEAGTVVGFVGNTGNARSTPPHLHFEVHPGGGAAVNPYPLLKIVDRAQRHLEGRAASGG